MKIIQTFWSGGKNLLQDNFGWYSSQHHLMAWTLSCLTINEQYKAVELYTDLNGHDILINKLKLPYGKVHVSLDDMNEYPRELWALPKVKTYSLQNEPFIHIDGDIFIWEKFEEKLHQSELIAQNFEKPTDYYKNKFLEVKKYLKYIPDAVNLSLDTKPMCSCNTGIIGGTDINFFKEYSSIIFDFVEKNDLNQIPAHVLTDFNIVFEQVLFYDLSQKHGKNVTCFFNKVFDDHGYKYDDIADFTTVPYVNKFLHLLGPHKRSKVACDLMSRVLLKDYPEYFFKVTSLFKEFHDFFTCNISKYSKIEKKDIKSLKLKFLKNEIPQFETSTEISDPVNEKFSITKLLIQSSGVNHGGSALCSTNIENIASQNPFTLEAFKYEMKLYETLKDFQKISNDYLLARDICSLKHFDFFYLPKEDQYKSLLVKDSLIKIIDTVYDWSISFESDMPVSINSSVSLACIPELFFSGYREVLIEDLDYNILTVLEKATTLNDLLEQLKECFDQEDIKTNYDKFYQLIMLKLRSLIYNKCIRLVKFEVIPIIS